MADTASVMRSYGGLKWWHFRGPSGTVAEKSRYEALARRAAADRLNCTENELVCTGWEPVTQIYQFDR